MRPPRGSCAGRAPAADGDDGGCDEVAESDGPAGGEVTDVGVPGGVVAGPLPAGLAATADPGADEPGSEEPGAEEPGAEEPGVLGEGSAVLPAHPVSVTAARVTAAVSQHRRLARLTAGPVRLDPREGDRDR